MEGRREEGTTFLSLLSGHRANPSEAMEAGAALLLGLPPPPGLPPAGPPLLPAPGRGKDTGLATHVVFLFVLHTMAQKNILLICNLTSIIELKETVGLFLDKFGFYNIQRGYIKKIKAQF